MPLDHSLEATPVTVGNLDEIAPDLPVGAFTGSVTVTNRKSNNGSYPQLVLDWTAEESQTDDDTGIGGSVREYLTFSSTKAINAAKRRIAELCEAYEIEKPGTESIEEKGNFESLEAFVESLESSKHPFWTTHRKRADTGEVQVNIHATEPGQKLQPAAEEEDEDKRPAKKPASKAATKTPAKKPARR